MKNKLCNFFISFKSIHLFNYLSDILYRVKYCFLMTKYVVGGSMIKEYRKKRGLTQEELAEKVNLSTRQLQRIEKNEHQTSIDTLLNIINTLNIPDEEIIKTFKAKKTTIPS